MKYWHYIIKRKIENIFIFPFILLGRLIAILKPLNKEYRVFFFFPFYHTGGAEKVHALITQAVGNTNCIIFFSRKSVDNTFYKDFEISGCTIKDISAYTDNKWLYFFNLIYRGIITEYINNQNSKPIVFNGQCNFGYKISPWVNSNIKQIELIHSFNTFSWIRIPFIPFITQTVMISKVRIENHINQYKQLNIPIKHVQNITYISNGINIPQSYTLKNFSEPLQVIFVGRCTIEKRVHLIGLIAENIYQTNPEISVSIIGDTENSISDSIEKYCNLKGKITNEKELNLIYQNADILLITSDTEGFPLVAMEAMANGCIVIATPVGDLPIHLDSSFITSSVNAEILVKEMTLKILDLKDKIGLLKEISQRNRQYAIDNFDLKIFNEKYISLFSG